MRQYARLLDLDEAPLGGTLSTGVTATDTTLYVEDAGDFAEDGGLLILEDTLLTYTAADHETGVITLAGAAGVTADADATFAQVADDDGQPVVEIIGLVRFDDSDPTDEPILAEIDYALLPYLSEGLRSPEDAEIVEVEVTDEGYARVVNLAEGRVTDTGDMSASASGFTGSFRVVKHGPVAFIVGSCTHASLDDFVWTNTGVVVPPGFRPATLEEFPPSSTWEAFTSWGYRLQPDGRLQIRRGAPSNTTMPLKAPYIPAP